MSDDILETRLLGEISRLKNEIAALQSDLTAAERLLVRIRHAKIETKYVTRKNSAHRLLIEDAIISSLRDYPKNNSSANLFEIARLRDPFLKEVTFRSCLHRMKEKGLIAPGPEGRGSWQLKSSHVA